MSTRENKSRIRYSPIPKTRRELETRLWSENLKTKAPVIKNYLNISNSDKLESSLGKMQLSAGIRLQNSRIFRVTIHTRATVLQSKLVLTLYPQERTIYEFIRVLKLDIQVIFYLKSLKRRLRNLSIPQVSEFAFTCERHWWIKNYRRHLKFDTPENQLASTKWKV